MDEMFTIYWEKFAKLHIFLKGLNLKFLQIYTRVKDLMKEGVLIQELEYETNEVLDNFERLKDGPIKKIPPVIYSRVFNWN
jgi:hypothetical protein